MRVDGAFTDQGIGRARASGQVAHVREGQVSWRIDVACVGTCKGPGVGSRRFKGLESAGAAVPRISYRFRREVPRCHLTDVTQGQGRACVAREIHNDARHTSGGRVVVSCGPSSVIINSCKSVTTLVQSELVVAVAGAAGAAERQDTDGSTTDRTTGTDAQQRPPLQHLEHRRSPALAGRAGCVETVEESAGRTAIGRVLRGTKLHRKCS